MAPRKLLLVLAALSLMALVVAAWVGWVAWHVNRDLARAVTDADTLQAAVTAGDDAAARSALERLTSDTRSAEERTNGLTWSVMAHTPIVGDDARGVRLTSSVAARLSERGVGPLVQVAGRLDALTPRDASISVGAVTSLAGPVQTGAQEFADADRRLSSVDDSGYVGPLQEKFRVLRQRVATAAHLLATADTAARVLPDMLGATGPKNYLLVFQNNAEIRATGGLPGAVSLVHTENGKVEMTRQVAANTFGATRTPVLPLSASEKQIFGRQLGLYFLDANFTPDFPRTAELMRARWEQVYPEKLDGVISIDPVALSYLLAATGPVKAGDVTLTTTNVVDELLHEVYLRYADPRQQDAYFRAVSRAVFDTVSSGTESPQDLIRALARGAAEHRIYVHSFDDQVQADLAGSQVAGELVTDPEASPQVGVYLNDATGAKMSYYLRYRVQVDATSCQGGRQRLSAKAHLLSDAPADAASLPDYVTGAGVYGTKPGSQLVLVRLFSPVGGDISGVELNGKPIGMHPTVLDGRTVLTTVVSLKPQFTVDLTWRMTTGDGQTGDIATSVTPSVLPQQSSSVTSSACS